MIVLGMILGAIILLIGVVLGIALHAMHASRQATIETSDPGEPQPICGCNHHYSFHNEDGCGHHYFDHLGREVTCGCKKYVGPEPLPRYISEVGP